MCTYTCILIFMATEIVVVVVITAWIRFVYSAVITSASIKLSHTGFFPVDGARSKPPMRRSQSIASESQALILIFFVTADL